MANNYFISSVTLHKVDKEKPFVFGPIGTALLSAATAWFDFTDGIGVSDSETSCPMFEDMILTLLKAIPNYPHEGFPDKFFFATWQNYVLFCDKHYGHTDWTSPELRDWLIKDDCMWDSLELDVVMVIVQKEIPNTNILGYGEEYCTYCDRLRYGEFTGGGLFVGDYFSFHTGRFRFNDGEEFGPAVSRCIINGENDKAVGMFWNEFYSYINAIKSEGLKNVILKGLKERLDTTLADRQSLKLEQAILELTRVAA